MRDPSVCTPLFIKEYTLVLEVRQSKTGAWYAFQFLTLLFSPEARQRLDQVRDCLLLHWAFSYRCDHCCVGGSSKMPSIPTISHRNCPPPTSTPQEYTIFPRPLSVNSLAFQHPTVSLCQLPMKCRTAKLGVGIAKHTRLQVPSCRTASKSFVTNISTRVYWNISSVCPMRIVEPLVRICRAARFPSTNVPPVLPTSSRRYSPA